MTEDQLVAAIDEHKRRIEQWRSLEQHPAWKELCHHSLSRMVVIRDSAINSRIRSMDEAFQRADELAEANAIQQILGQPTVQVQTLEAGLIFLREQLATAQMEDEYDTGTERPDADIAP